MTGVFLASFILMGVFLLPYFAYIFGRDIPFSRTTMDIGNLLWPLAIFAVLLYEDKKGKLGIWRNPSLGMNLKTAILSLALGVLWQLVILLLTSLFDVPNTVILCLMYMRTKDVRYCVITHVTCNLMGFFSAYYFV